jgi:hypothetical protein
MLVDAWAGPDGCSVDLLAPEVFRNWVDSATSDGMIATPPASMVGVTDPSIAAWLETQLTPQPRRTLAGGFSQG